MSKATGYAADSAQAALKTFRFERRDPNANDVEIEILYCGVCHSDIHQARNEWHNTVYPCVPGHEIVGRVTRVGSGVKKFKQGDLAGVGCLVDSCKSCPSCNEGLEQYCENGWTGTYNGPTQGDKQNTYGGYSDHIVVREDFVLHIPENLDLKAVAPLLCAGITMYSPLRHWNIGADHKIAVAGLGGLGHMAVKLAKAMGAHVTLITTSPEKGKDAARLGADEVLISKDLHAMAAHQGKFDFILSTIPTGHNADPYVALLKRDGTLIFVGCVEPLDPAPNVAQLILGRRSMAGSVIGGIEETQEMLDFCAKHNIVSDIEMINIQDINESYERMIKGDVKYRFVIDMASLKNAA